MRQASWPMPNGQRGPVIGRSRRKSAASRRENATLARTAHSLADLAGWRVGMLRLRMRAWAVLLLVDDHAYRRVGRVGLVGTVSAHGGAVPSAVDQQVAAGPSERRQLCAKFYADMAEQIGRPFFTAASAVVTPAVNTAHVDQ